MKADAIVQLLPCLTIWWLRGVIHAAFYGETSEMKADAIAQLLRVLADCEARIVANERCAEQSEDIQAALVHQARAACFRSVVHMLEGPIRELIGGKRAS